MIRRVLKNKLVGLGYATTYVESKVKEFNITVDTSQLTESEILQKLHVIVYEKPTAEIPKFFLNTSGNLVDKFLFDGKVNAFPRFSVIGSQVNLVDYPLDEKACMIGITADAEIYLVLYMPDRDTLSRFSMKTYENIYAEERESIASDYLEALTAGNRLSTGKAKDILYVLMSEFVIDTILVENANPKLKLYDNATKFADMITGFEFKYINRRVNRVEYVEKEVSARYMGAGVKLGFLSNDPYLRLSEVNQYPVFPLNRPTYVWLTANSRGQEEIAIYTANESYARNDYKEMILDREEGDLRKEADRLTMQFSGETGYQISREYVLSVLKKLNRQLIIMPMDIIRNNSAESAEYIEPLRYRFSVIKNRKEFESILYNAIDDNISGRYRYRFVEKLSGIYTTIGNKLNYTDQEGKNVRKQSVADFNINFNAAVVKRETLIDASSVSQLLGFMYKDLDETGTDLLPVPSIEVVFYFPEVTMISQEVEMYNGTPVEQARGDGEVSYNAIGENVAYQSTVRPKDPNEKYIVVKYVNADGETLKENIIRDVAVGSNFVPELLPIINDREGKEWYCEPSQMLSLVVSNDNTKNEISVKYLRKMTRVHINYINKVGSELMPPVIKNMQVGEAYPMETAKKFVDASKVEWNLYQSKPAKFVASEDEKSNVLTLVYDVIKCDVFVYYQTRDGREIKPADKVSSVVNHDFTPEIPRKIVENDGLTWKYANDSKATIRVQEGELNTVVLLYDELKKRVTTHFFDEKGLKVKDDVVEIAQVGKLMEFTYKTDYVDIFNRYWTFKAIDKPTLKVSENEEENVCVITYDKVLVNIIVSMVNENGKRIKDDIIEKAQIGSSYKPTAIKDIEDASGKGWICIDDTKEMVVDASELKNHVSYQYKPYMTKVFVQYIDAEGNELLPQKESEVQVGSIFTPDFIASLVGKDQRAWVLSANNIKEFKVKKHKEENIIKVNYDKKLVDIHLSFRNLNGTQLKEDITIQEQLGSEFKAGIYERITAENGERWMVAKSEPETMFVRENSHFLLIYDEIKAKVVVKCVNISDSKSIVNDMAITTKLGGVFVPNIQQKVVDKMKRRWTYVGEPGMSIVAKENEQENIVILKYEPDRANVTLKYLNKNQQMVHADVVNAEQIGSEVVIKEYDKVFEDNGMGWKLKNMSRKSFIVDEDEEKNVVICNYEPLMVPVTTRYINEEVNEITASKVDQVQVGETFRAVVIPRITDNGGKLWEYSNIKLTDLKVKDDDNNRVNIKYLPVKKLVTERFLNEQNEVLTKEKTELRQVGDEYVLQKQERVVDAEDKSWIYSKSSQEKIKVLEEEEKNVISNYYVKELTKVTIRYQTNEGVTLDKDKVLDLQIGSIYTIEPKETLDDNDKLSWILSAKNELKVKIKRNPEENIYTVVYERFMVNVYDKYLNEADGKELIPPTVTKHQVGSSYLVTVKESIVDEEGKHWVQAAKSDIKIFTSSYKIEPITVIREEARNVTVVKYKPKLADTVIRYQDPLGRTIKPEETKKLQVGSTFAEDIPTKIVDSLGNKWSYNPNSNSDVKISENPAENVVVLAYEEFKGTVTFYYYDKAKNELQKPTKKLVQIGNIYVPQFDTILTDEKGCVWEYAERNVEKIEVKEEEKDNIVELTYIPLNADVELVMIDLWGNAITTKKKVPAQLGSEFTPTVSQTFTNEQSLLYRLTKMEPKSVVVKELPIGAEKNPNHFQLTYEPVNSNVVIRFQDLDGNALKDDEKINLQVGKKYKPEPSEFIKDKKGNEWQLANAKTDEITVLENENENVIRYVYEVAKADIIVRFINVDGLTVMPEQHFSQQVGSDFVPAPEEFLTDAENKKWKLLRVQPVNLHVGSINNIVTVTYQEEKTRVTWQFCNEEGAILKPEQRFEAQIGMRYTPNVKDRIIYDASEIWRLVKIEPSEIIISENPTENVVKLIYSNQVKETKTETKKELVNPFANTLTAEEEAELEAKLQTKANKEPAREIVREQSVAPEVAASMGGVTANVTPQAGMASGAATTPQQDFEFEDEDLRKLARSMSLTVEEKRAINEINNMNAKIVEELRKSKAAYQAGQKYFDYTNVENLIAQEKEMVKANLDKLIAQDKTGARLLKIFEHITASEKTDATFNKLQQRKAVLITDYFLDKPLEEMEKVLYICEHGKNVAKINILDKKMEQGKITNMQEAVELKTTLYYEKLMLDNYYKARNLSSDNYFTDNSVKQATLPNIVVGVTNTMVKQILTALKKETIDLAGRIEVEGILSQCTPQQVGTIKAEIDKWDGKQKRAANKLLQDIEKGK